ncbi:MAG TPA: type IV toxin-antitoxin system AbiEi family antitoxin domain-containing protein, partial [Marmoricola sp.]|nr:type IV toxin-antitoxin system AbiEi family antitoxin domain-containing protein [Marmoricola sp.]
MERYVQSLLADQSGTVARPQLVVRGIADHEIRRWVRRRELVRVHRGVFVDHTGGPTWLQNAWCAVLATSAFDDAGEPTGSALARESALRLLDGPGSRIAENVRMQVAIDNSRFISGPAEIALERCRHLNERVTYRSGLPCVRYEDALIDVAPGVGRWDSFALLANAVTGRKTTVARLAQAAERRNWMHQRDWFMQVVADITNGTCSVLEKGFVTEVLRPHALPRPRQQSREVTPIGVVYRDSVFGGVVV